MEVSWLPSEEAGAASWGAPRRDANLCLDSSCHMLVHQTEHLESKGSCFMPTLVSTVSQSWQGTDSKLGSPQERKE